MANVLRNIPSVNELLESPALKRLVDKVSHSVVVSGAREFLDNLKGDLQAAATEIRPPSAADLADRIAEWILDDRTPGPRPVVNATGVLIRADLGGVPLADEALEAVADTARAYCSLEVDLKSGERWQRTAAVEKALRRLTGAEAAVVVNNAAGATLLALTALATEKEVVVARGQLAEREDGFRLTEAAAQCGAVLREVGAANKTRLADYQQAIGPQTAALFRAPARGYEVVGETEQVSLAELVALGRRRQVPVIDDVGGAALIDVGKFGLSAEPVARESIKAGADLVLLDGGELLGGPSCGILVGRRALCQKINQHPLMRALRVEKMTLAALAATLRLYDDPQTAERAVPLLSLLATPIENLQNRAGRLAPQIAAAEAVAAAEPVEGLASLTASALPRQQLPTWLISVTPAKGTAEEFASSLRSGKIAVLSCVESGNVLLDLRTVLPSQDRMLVAAIEALSGQKPGPADVPPEPAAPDNGAVESD